MKKHIFIWFFSLLLAMGIFFLWYSQVPPMISNEKNTFSHAQEIMSLSGDLKRYKDQKLLLYGNGQAPKIEDGKINFLNGTWLLRSIDSTSHIVFSWPKLSGIINGKWTIFLDFEKGIMLSIDASLFWEKSEKILPSFYMQEGKNSFFDLWTIEEIVPKDVWKLYKENVLNDEKDVFSWFSENEMVKNINILLEREPDKKNVGNMYFQKDVRVRTILEDIKKFVEETRKEKKCWNNPEECLKFITDNIAKWEAIDPHIFEWLEEPLLMWAKKNSNTSSSFSWESIFQKYHLDVLSGNKLAINMRDGDILKMIRSSSSPTYEMWLYLTFILWKENKWSPYALQIMTEMVRIGEILKSGEHKKTIAEESNMALASLKKILEETYFDKKEDYIFVLKQNLQDETGTNLDTKIFVNDLNSLIIEIDKSTLFLEYPDFRILRRHLVWFTCLFEKNKEYLQDIRICRATV